MAKRPHKPKPAPRPLSGEAEITIDGMAHGGAGVGRHQNRAVFVPYTIPGERVRVRLLQADERGVRAEGRTLVEASADRVYPVCPHFGPGRCGRCHWQHIAYEAQLLIKQDVLAEQLERLGGLKNPPVRPTIASPIHWNYNHHMTFNVVEGEKRLVPDDDGDGQVERSTWRLGFPGANGGTFAPIEVCHIIHPDLLDLYDQFDFELEGVKRVRLQIGSDGGRMIILLLRDESVPELETDLTASVNVLLPDNAPMNLIGDSHSRFTLHSQTFRATAGSAFRANVAALPLLVDAVRDALDLKPSDNVLDLYAGVGVFSAFLAPNAARVTLAESYPPAATDADENLAAFDNIDVIEGSVESLLDDDEFFEADYAAAVVDPPSPGLGGDVIAGLAERGVRRLVYVSDDPAALGRDARRLAQAGYQLQTVQAIDLSPQTYYIDSVALFLHT